MVSSSSDTQTQPENLYGSLQSKSAKVFLCFLQRSTTPRERPIHSFERSVFFLRRDKDVVFEDCTFRRESLAEVDAVHITPHDSLKEFVLYGAQIDVKPVFSEAISGKLVWFSMVSFDVF